MKRTRKIQVLCTEDMYQTFERMMFWYRAEGLTDKNSMSAFVRDILQNHIDDTPEEYKQPLKRIKR
jgi:DNA gyrase inhibitor GyrI